MPDTSPVLSLPYIQPAQAQKHITHNEAIEALDILVQLVVAGFDALEPPEAPEPGATFALGAEPTGAWEGHGGELAAHVGGGWRFFVPQDGWIAVEQATGAVRVRQGDGWSSGSDAATRVPTLGVATTADEVNRLSVSAEGTLLTHDGAGHRVTVNKSSAAETASLLFQSDFSGRAEIGLAGDDALSIKVSLDGVEWVTALRADPATGLLDGSAVQSGPADVTPGRLMRADYGYGRGNLLGSVAMSEGMPSGAVIESGGTEGAGYIRFADGTQICRGYFAETDVNFFVERAGGYMCAPSDVHFAASFADTPTMSFSVPGNIHALPMGASVKSDRFSPRLWSAVAGRTAIEAWYIAIGRWA